eukprot:466091-Rhodomonas_salina.2
MQRTNATTCEDAAKYNLVCLEDAPFPDTVKHTATDDHCADDNVEVDLSRIYGTAVARRPVLEASGKWPVGSRRSACPHAALPPDEESYPAS